MKIKILVLILCFLSCTKSKTKVVENINHTTPIDITIKPIDSFLYYFNKQLEFGMQRDNYEIKYLRTRKDKYRIMGNKCVDSSHYYSKNVQRIRKML